MVCYVTKQKLEGLQSSSAAPRMPGFRLLHPTYLQEFSLKRVISTVSGNT